MHTKSYRPYLAVFIAACLSFVLSAYWAVLAEPSDGVSPQHEAPRQPTLPTDVRRTIEAMFPDGKIEEVGLERQVVQFYEVSVIVDGRKSELTLTSDGTVLEIEKRIDTDSAPKAVRDKIVQLAQDGALKEVEQVEVHARLQAVPLKEPQIIYEAEFRMATGERGVRLSQNGESVDVDDENDHED